MKKAGWPKIGQVKCEWAEKISPHINIENNLSRSFQVFRLDCAIDFRNFVFRACWEKYGLPKDLGVRISLDAGPVFSYYDPIAGQTDFCGRYVIRAARIEPITPPGEIYTSESFAALVTSRGNGEVKFDYAGQLRLAKNYEVAPVYHVRKTLAAGDL